MHIVLTTYCCLIKLSIRETPLESGSGSECLTHAGVHDANSMLPARPDQSLSGVNIFCPVNTKPAATYLSAWLSPSALFFLPSPYLFPYLSSCLFPYLNPFCFGPGVTTALPWLCHPANPGILQSSGPLKQLPDKAGRWS